MSTPPIATNNVGITTSGASPTRSPIINSPSAAAAIHSSPPQVFAIVRLAAAIRSQRDRIAAAELVATGQLESATRHQCDLALRFIAHYAAHNAGTNIESLAYVKATGNAAATATTATTAATEQFHIDGGRRRSLFEIFAGVAVHLRVGHAVTVRLDAARGYLRAASILGDCCAFAEALPAEGEQNAAPGSTQVVFDSADAAAAFAELNTAHADRTAPWRIRVCWVQESMRPQFEATFAESAGNAQQPDLVERVRPLGGTVRYTSSCQPLVVDVPLPLWTPLAADFTEVVLVQFFRTCKDCIVLLRKQAAASIQSLSVWTENYSLTLELAASLPDALNIWQNCVGLLDPSVPFTLGDSIYGSELALCQTVIAPRDSQRGVELTKLSTAFAAELAAENGDYSAMRLLAKMAYMTSSRRKAVAASGATSPEVEVADWVLQAKDVQKRRLIVNVLFNRVQTMVVPYGTIFAN